MCIAEETTVKLHSIIRNVEVSDNLLIRLYAMSYIVLLCINIAEILNL